MKKLLTTALAIIYLSSSIGATLHLHYCMGRIISWGFINHESKNCTTCGMPKGINSSDFTISKEGCCKDESKFIKTDNDQKPSQAGFDLSKWNPSVGDTNQVAFSDFFPSSIAIDYPTANAPPLLINGVPVYLFNCNFRI